MPARCRAPPPGAARRAAPHPRWHGRRRPAPPGADLPTTSGLAPILFRDLLALHAGGVGGRGAVTRSALPGAPRGWPSQTAAAATAACRTCSPASTSRPWSPSARIRRDGCCSPDRAELTLDDDVWLASPAGAGSRWHRRTSRWGGASSSAPSPGVMMLWSGPRSRVGHPRCRASRRWSACSSRPRPPACTCDRTSRRARRSTGCSAHVDLLDHTHAPAAGGDRWGRPVRTRWSWSRTRPRRRAAVALPPMGQIGRVALQDATHYPLSGHRRSGVGADGRTVETLRLRVDRTAPLIADVDVATIAAPARPGGDLRDRLVADVSVLGSDGRGRSGRPPGRAWCPPSRSPPRARRPPRREPGGRRAATTASPAQWPVPGRRLVAARPGRRSRRGRGPAPLGRPRWRWSACTYRRPRAARGAVGVDGRRRGATIALTPPFSPWMWFARTTGTRAKSRRRRRRRQRRLRHLHVGVDPKGRSHHGRSGTASRADAGHVPHRGRAPAAQRRRSASTCRCGS